MIFSSQSTAGTAHITNSNGGILLFFDRSSAENATIVNNDVGSVVFSNRSSAGNATIINNSFFPIGAVAFENQSTAENATIITNAGSATFFFDRSNGGNAQFITAAGGVVDFSGTGGPANLGKISAGSIAGAGDYFLGSNELTVGSNNLSTEVSGTINDGAFCGCAGTGASLVKIGTGTLILSGLNTYTGPTTVNVGSLIVNGSIAASSLLTVNPGGLVGGIGFLPETLIDGGTLSPGNSIGAINILAGLTFTPGSFYRVEVDRTTSDLTNIAGQATLAGTVQVSSPTGAYKFNSPYTILSAVGGLVGQFNTVTTGPFVTGVVNNVGNDVLLTLSSNLRGFAGNNLNQQSVAAGLDRGFNALGNNAGFEALFLLPPGSLPNAMTQLSGEIATAVGPAGLEATNQFHKLMLDPFAGTRGEAGGGPALGFAPERQVSKEAASAYAAYRSILKAPAPASYEPRWTTWAAVYGSTSNARGDLGIGSHDRDLRVGGVAAGADYRVSPNTVVGFALTGAGTNFGLSDGLGTGRGDVLQGGVYGATRFDNYYLAASLAASYYDVSTERIVSLPGATSHLTASFGASGFGARIEGGRRFVVAKLGVTPFVAVQAQSVHTPGYTEQGVGAPFALAYSEQTTSRLRSELGATFDAYVGEIWGGGLSMYWRMAWAHQYWRDNSINALFPVLPVSGFTVQGATAPADALLLASGAEYKFGNGLSLRGKLEAELANSATTFAASAMFRASW